MKWLPWALNVLACIMVLTAGAQKKFPKDSALLQRADEIFLQAAEQYRMLKENLPKDKFPKTYFPQTGQYEWSNSSWWCSGFYPGTLLMLYKETRQQWLLDEANRMLSLLEKEQFNTTTHDLGFMMFNSFGLANNLNPSHAYDEVLVNSAKSLSSRFNPGIGCIKSWDSRNPNDFLVIIDNMMNLELLFWASEVTQDSRYREIAIMHANTTLKNHFRKDFSSYHVLNYDIKTGKVKEKKTAQGYNNESAWARGQAWGLYGYTVMFRFENEAQYLNLAMEIADFLLNHLPEDKIPFWDFNAPDIPNALRDASAAAIMASALLELSNYTGDVKGKEYFDIATAILKTLCSPEYLAAPGTNGGFLIKHGVGHKPAGTEVNVPLTYADYYFVEALIRYKGL